MNAVVQVPAYDEPADLFRRRLASISAQEPPPGWDVTFEAWITPVDDADPSFEIAREVGVQPFRAPPGKLSARNAAHAHAVDAGVDAIVSWDADAPPLRHDALVGLLEPLEREDVVAVNSDPVAAMGPDGGLSMLGMLVDAGGAAEDAVNPHLHGQAASLTTAAWSEVGPFDESIDQTVPEIVRDEEEFGLWADLQAMGTIAADGRALVYNDPRRHFCRVAPEFAPPDYCGRRGAETFSRVAQVPDTTRWGRL